MGASVFPIIQVGETALEDRLIDLLVGLLVRFSPDILKWVREKVRNWLRRKP